jgi:hypothetical protein
VRVLQDRQALLERMAVQLEQRDMRRSARSLTRRAEEAEEQAEVLKVTLDQVAGTTLRRIADGDEVGAGGAGEEALDAG